MNPTAADPAPPPPPPPQPPRSSFSCDRHPEEKFSGFCPSCLCERLTTLDQSSSNPSSSSRRPSTSSASAAAAIKSLFSSSSRPSTSSFTTTAGNSSNPPPPKPSSSKQTSFFPELRRTKSFSASKHEGLGLNFSGAFEPQRKSCDVRVRNTLWSLFTIDDESKPTCSSSRPSSSSIPKDSTETYLHKPVFESKEEEDDDEEEEPEIGGSEGSNNGSSGGRDDDITPVALRVQEAPGEIVVERGDINLEIVEEEEVFDFGAMKPMKDHIDLDSQSKKAPATGGGRDLKEIAGSFWSAASVFSKKWHNWRRKQKLKKRSNGELSATLPVEKPISRQYRETQSEIADYGFGRRSCDTDPRFSLDAGRISFDDGRYSFDEPRASWDGYLIGNRGNYPRMMPPMVSVVEDAPVVHVPRADGQIPVEEPNEDDRVPGGSAQTKEYYSDSSSRRRKSLDRSNSIRKTAAAVVAEIDEMKAVSSNAKVLPATTTMDYVNGVNNGAKESCRERDANSNSLRDDCSETFELNASVVGNGERKGPKKSRRWSWKIWGFIQRRGGNKDDDDDRYSKVNGVERSLSESWANGDGKEGFNRKVFRSNSSVSWRNSNYIGGAGSFGGGSVRKFGVEMTNGNVNGKKRRDEFVLERNRSARYSPNDVDNGLLRFYLTPLRGSRRGVGGGGGVVPAAKIRPNGAHSIARSVLRLY
ncbi:OLC1v1035030C1 [Oldenlandia corymbosa var. corymbosa]|uniref:OLC1v1035030C1 n=1 Tax=Oldenlandia corymbosa var. corymbosa TaxID=529605 RepID=A0AAV1CTA7_OLDCO|nr:OLC1v1035030C1 [Oldenlandia corymbosa var. corymbosa]